eukprot:365535-Chlamydomonas_euryale.AAC.20
MQNRRNKADSTNLKALVRANGLQVWVCPDLRIVVVARFQALGQRNEPRLHIAQARVTARNVEQRGALLPVADQAGLVPAEA